MKQALIKLSASAIFFGIAMTPASALVQRDEARDAADDARSAAKEAQEAAAEAKQNRDLIQQTRDSIDASIRESEYRQRLRDMEDARKRLEAAEREKRILGIRMRERTGKTPTGSRKRTSTATGSRVEGYGGTTTGRRASAHDDGDTAYEVGVEIKKPDR